MASPRYTRSMAASTDAFTRAAAGRTPESPGTRASRKPKATTSSPCQSNDLRVSTPAGFQRRRAILAVEAGEQGERRETETSVDFPRPADDRALRLPAARRGRDHVCARPEERDRGRRRG